MATYRTLGDAGRDIFLEFSQQREDFAEKEEKRFDDDWERCNVFEDTLTIDDLLPQEKAKKYIHNSRKAFLNCVWTGSEKSVKLWDGVTKIVL